MDTQPDVYASVVRLLAEGNSPRKIAGITATEVKVIRGIRDLHPETPLVQITVDPARALIP